MKKLLNLALISHLELMKRTLNILEMTCMLSFCAAYS